MAVTPQSQAAASPSFLGQLSQFASAFGPIGQAVGAIGSLIGGSKSPSRKREFDSYVLQQRAHRENIQPLSDAYKAAGFHPLLSVGQSPTLASAAVNAGEPNTAARLGEFGQNIGRAAAAYQTADERAYTSTVQNMTLERMGLENELLRSQITRINKPTNPSIPGSRSNMDGQGIVEMVPHEQVFSAPHDNTKEAGTITTHTFAADGTIVPSKQMKERIEDDIISQVLWHLQNRINRPDDPKGHPGKVWDNFKQKYVNPPKSWVPHKR